MKTILIREHLFEAYWKNAPIKRGDRRVRIVLSLIGLLVLWGVLTELATWHDPLAIPTYDSVAEMVAREMGYSPGQINVLLDGPDNLYLLIGPMYFAKASGYPPVDDARRAVIEAAMMAFTVTPVQRLTITAVPFRVDSTSMEPLRFYGEYLHASAQTATIERSGAQYLLAAFYRDTCFQRVFYDTVDVAPIESTDRKLLAMKDRKRMTDLQWGRLEEVSIYLNIHHSDDYLHFYFTTVMPRRSAEPSRRM